MGQHDGEGFASRRRILMAAGLAAGLAPAAALVGQQGGPAAAATTGGSPRFVPVPERARPPQIPPKGYLLDHLGGGVYGVRDGVYQSMFLVTRTGVVVVDAPQQFGARLLAAIGEVTDRPVTHVVYSHSHLDHTGSAHLFRDTARYVGHELTGQLLQRAGDPRRPVPTRTFPGRRHTLVVGGERLVLEYRGDNHQAGNLFIYAPEPRVLMLVDIIDVRWAPFFRLGLTSNVRAYMDATDQILGYQFDTFIGGHVGHFGTRADVEDQARYVADLRAAAMEALRTVDFVEATRGVPADNPNGQFKVYTDALVDRAMAVMPTTWLTRLGGADVFLRDNASAMAFSLLID